VHRVAALARRWLPSTRQGSVDDAYLPSYLNELCLRGNRRAARHRGLVFLRLPELAVAHDPVRRNGLVPGGGVPRRRPPVSAGRGGHPTGVGRASASRPWRSRPGLRSSG
jgi:hypothetical protein